MASGYFNAMVLCSIGTARDDEVWTWFGLVKYYVLFFIELESRQVHIAGMKPHPDVLWMQQVTRNVTMNE